MDIPVPFELHRTVGADWIDPNGHMSLIYYYQAFIEATDALLDDLDVGWKYTRKERKGVFLLSMNTDIEAEALEGDRICVQSQLLDWDHKRMHMAMQVVREGERLAFAELLFIHVCLERRESEPFPDWAMALIGEVGAAHGALFTPRGLGRTLGIRRR